MRPGFGRQVLHKPRLIGGELQLEKELDLGVAGVGKGIKRAEWVF